jgi:hypothetical protein
MKSLRYSQSWVYLDLIYPRVFMGIRINRWEIEFTQSSSYSLFTIQITFPMDASLCSICYNTIFGPNQLSKHLFYTCLCLLFPLSSITQIRSFISCEKHYCSIWMSWLFPESDRILIKITNLATTNWIFFSVTYYTILNFSMMNW